ncbi:MULTISPECIES: MarR family transcriptional regulator [unclassified Micromonospora]|uniref:MarR family winged helix-turn-helix transcriptional regulator n=1 Tax=unclassified Micromonospora TaxID=2617518 RepID=UPI00188FFB74|nr:MULTISPECIES: MarR family transcriptional regulator [unclassified Micromonospora]MBF5028371.1 MarR family transcriptional regulator [Micromonospora sp. ANENR4]MCZ7473158.1 MarR family transcriptional regulator [Micromonospora sp. WMMC273]WBC03829.1 MarR family transcriptional regulator [Micromonospora sp. WMMA1976]
MDEPRWLDEQEDRAWRGYRRMRRLLDLELARELMQDAGLSEPDYDVLSDLSETPEQRLRLSELADRMLWSRSRLSHHISRMQQRGLVSREECVTDGRGSVVVLTPAGRRAVEAAAPGHVAAVRRHLIDRITPAEVAALGTLSQRVIRHLTGRPEAEG